jgi:hypothetical protein
MRLTCADDSSTSSVLYTVRKNDPLDTNAYSRKSPIAVDKPRTEIKT